MTTERATPAPTTVKILTERSAGEFVAVKADPKPYEQRLSGIAASPLDAAYELGVACAAAEEVREQEPSEKAVQRIFMERHPWATPLWGRPDLDAITLTECRDIRRELSVAYAIDRGASLPDPTEDKP